MRTAPPLTAPYFRSDGQARLLAVLVLLTDDGVELTIRDIAQRAELPYATAHKEIERQLAAGLFREHKVGNYRFIGVNPDSPLLQPVRDLLAITAGPVPLLAAELAEIDHVDEAFLYGSFAARLRGVAGDAPRDIDLMVIGTPDPTAVYDACTRVGDRVGRPVNPTIMTPTELGAKANSGFLTHIRQNPTVPVISKDLSA
jgi:hypothetical protein